MAAIFCGINKGYPPVTIYHLDLQGQLIAETTVAGNAQREYVYHGMNPIAQIDTKDGVEAIHYLHTDHLYTPRFATSQAQQIAWRWEGDGFGSTEAEEINLVVNLRFPGQYFDEESQLHYNWYRNYDPGLGRYIQSDPIGLDGGINTYGYVEVNPTKYIDVNGLSKSGPRPKTRVPVNIPNARIIRQQRDLEKAIQSIRDRIRNLEQNRQRNERELYELSDNLRSHVEEWLDLLVSPMQCAKMVCPWDPVEPLDVCPRPGHKVSPARSFRNGCYCQSNF